MADAVFTPGSEVWARVDGPEAWVPATVSGAPEAGGVLPLTLQDGSPSRAPPERLAARNTGVSGPVDDLVALPHLNEPEIVHVLHGRFNVDSIYTAVGPILLAVNPFKRLGALYTEAVQQDYYTRGVLSSSGDGSGANGLPPLPPHVFGVADRAYRALVAAAAASAGLAGAAAPPALDAPPRNQMLLVSGESGAGKTESTKFILQYLTSVGRARGGGASGGGASASIAKRVLDSNPVLEAFGNARTVRNDNSSRFGKLISLDFIGCGRDTGTLVSAGIETYLLEKVRLVTQAAGERNYHAFYQMLAGGSKADYMRWQLLESDADASDVEGSEGGSLEAALASFPDRPALPDVAGRFRALNQSGCFTVRDADDAEEHWRTKEAMCSMGIASRDVTALFDALAGLLHLSNVRFVEGSGGSGGESGKGGAAKELAVDPSVTASFDVAAALLGVSPTALLSALTGKEIVAGGGERFRTLFSPAQARVAVESLIKATYGRMFAWVVWSINRTLRGATASPAAATATSAAVVATPSRPFIGVLDIFGFESFVTNSLEQLCINYCNEALQQVFNSFVFKMEIAEYTKEAVPWTALDFPDNQDCLDLIESRQKPLVGILALLDEQCMLGNATDDAFARKCADAYKEHPRFGASQRHKAASQFYIRHFAGEVVYSTGGFLDKNRDTIHKEALEALRGAGGGDVAAAGADGAGRLVATWFLGEGPADAADAAALAPPSASGATPSPLSTAVAVREALWTALAEGTYVAGAGAAKAAASAAPAPAETKPGAKRAGSGAGASGGGSAGGGLVAETVARQFSGQLGSLITLIKGTTPHFVRCLKPNSIAAPRVLDRDALVAQLRCGGVLEAVRVARVGYPVRSLHASFLLKYGPVVPAAGWEAAAAAALPGGIAAAAGGGGAAGARLLLALKQGMAAEAAAAAAASTAAAAAVAAAEGLPSHSAVGARARGGSGFGSGQVVRGKPSAAAVRRAIAARAAGRSSDGAGAPVPAFASPRRGGAGAAPSPLQRPRGSPTAAVTSSSSAGPLSSLASSHSAGDAFPLGGRGAPSPGAAAAAAVAASSAALGVAVYRAVDWRLVASAATQSLALSEGTLQVGVTKVFLRKGALAELEARLQAALRGAAVRIQAWYRGVTVQHQAALLRWLGLKCQALARGWAARRAATAARRERAAAAIQTWARGALAARRYRRFRAAVVWAQARRRGAAARAAVAALRRALAATKLAAAWRCWAARRAHVRARAAAITLQCWARQRHARALLLRYRTEAREVGSLRDANAALQARLKELEAALAAAAAAGAAGSAAAVAAPAPVVSVTDEEAKTEVTPAFAPTVPVLPAAARVALPLLWTVVGALLQPGGTAQQAQATGAPTGPWAAALLAQATAASDAPGGCPALLAPLLPPLPPSLEEASGEEAEAAPTSPTGASSGSSAGLAWVEAVASRVKAGLAPAPAPAAPATPSSSSSSAGAHPEVRALRAKLADAERRAAASEQKLAAFLEAQVMGGAGEAAPGEAPPAAASPGAPATPAAPRNREGEDAAASASTPADAAATPIALFTSPAGGAPSTPAQSATSAPGSAVAATPTATATPTTAPGSAAATAAAVAGAFVELSARRSDHADAQIARLRRELESYKRQIAALERKVTSADALAASASAGRARAEEQAARLSEELGNIRTGPLVQYQAHVNELTDHVAGLRADLAARDIAVAEQEAIAAQLRAALETARAAVVDANDTADALRQAKAIDAETKMGLARRLEGALVETAELRAEVAALRGAAAAKERDLAHLQRKMGRLTAALANHNARMLDLHRREKGLGGGGGGEGEEGLTGEGDEGDTPTSPPRVSRAGAGAFAVPGGAAAPSASSGASSTTGSGFEGVPGLFNMEAALASPDRPTRYPGGASASVPGVPGDYTGLGNTIASARRRVILPGGVEALSSSRRGSRVDDAMATAAAGGGGSAATGTAASAGPSAPAAAGAPAPGGLLSLLSSFFGGSGGSAPAPPASGTASRRGSGVGRR